MTERIDWNEQRDVGMTCDGVVKLSFEVYDQSRRRITLFSAGHVASATIHCVLPLECRLTCIDARAE
ncbi:MAG: hypothetical protein AAF961_08005 [Planctomycetota bacterium]